jgi:hypothetical protein
MNTNKTEMYKQIANETTNTETVSIPIGTKVIFERPDGSTEVYVLRCRDPVQWEDTDGVKQMDAHQRPYVSLKIVTHP